MEEVTASALPEGHRDDMAGVARKPHLQTFSIIYVF
jgi:hypothetical protein